MSTGLPRVALDAMGGDHAPAIEVAGAIAAVRTGAVRVTLVGEQARVRHELRRAGAESLEGPRLQVRHASEVIRMDDAPSAAVRRKRDASMRVAVDMVAAGEADAVVSAGHSGAMMACALFVLRRIPGVDRPAILATFPTRGGDAALLDMGANVDCRPLNLAQFAVLGASYAHVVLGRARPRVGVLSNGSEAHKGTELTRETHRLLDGASPVGWTYVGYVEGRDVFSGGVDVVVCDGFSGNLVLKVSEGAAETIFAMAKSLLGASLAGKLIGLALKPALQGLKRRIDYAERGGAPLVGVQGTAMICHGGSNAKAIKNAILGAARHAQRGVVAAMTQGIAEHEVLFAPLRKTPRARQVSASGTPRTEDGDAAEDERVACG